MEKASKSVVLSIDDDRDMQFVLGEFLAEEGFGFVPVHGGRELDEIIGKTHFDVALLDLMLPDVNGMSLIQKIQSVRNVPVIIISGKTSPTERIVGLEMGADDYMTKPYEMRELSARIRAVLRRTEAQPLQAAGDSKPAAANANAAEQIKFKDWVLDRTQYQAFDHKGTSFNLTTGEFKLLEVLALSCNRVITREHLYETIRQSDYESFDRAIDIQIGRVRKKIEGTKAEVVIKTVRGVGYMLCADPLK